MTDQTMRAAGAPQFSIGNVLGTSFTVVSQNLLKFAAVPAVLIIPLVIVGFLIGFGMMRDVVPALQSGAMPTGGFFTGMVALGLLFLCWSSLTSAVIVSGAFQALRMHSVQLGSAFRRGFAALVPVVLTTIALFLLFLVVMIVCTVPLGIIIALAGGTAGASLGFALGIFIALVPGAILWTMFWLYTPAIVVEAKGVGSSLSRSRELTKGRRWAVFGVIAIIIVANFALDLINRYVIGAVLGSVVQGVVSLALMILLQAYTATALTVTYYYLRADKEGISIDEIARVFD